MRWTATCLGAVALSALAAAPAGACSPLMPGFADLAREPMQAVVVGRFVPVAGGRFVPVAGGRFVPVPGGRSESSLFEVQRVLHGDLAPGRYRLSMTGPWGSACEVYAMEATGPVAAAGNPVVVLVKKIGRNELDLPFGIGRARLSGGRIEAQSAPDRARVRRISTDLTAFTAWLKAGGKGPLKWRDDGPAR